MADDEQPRAQPPGGDDELEQTRPHDPVQDTAESVEAGPWQSPSGPSGVDDTQAVARGDETAAVPPGEETAVLPAPGRDRWTARAGIPPAGPFEPAETYDPDQDGRGWWVPVVLALLGLLLLAALAAGVWLILQARGGPDPVPTASPAPTARPTTASPTPPPTSPASPTPSQPVPVRVPPLVGLTLSGAQQVLETVGLAYLVQERVDPDSQPDRVIEVDPAEGTLVPPGSRVTLVVAVAPPTTGAPSPSASATPTPG